MRLFELVLILGTCLALSGCNERTPVQMNAGGGPSQDVVISPVLGKQQQTLLHITATVDGSGRVIFTDRSVQYEHKHWGPPTNVTINDEPWIDLNETPSIWKKLCAHLDLKKAKIITRSGRDVVALEQTADGFDLYLSDSPNGSDEYEVTIAIPRRE